MFSRRSSFPVLPRIGEDVKIRNSEPGDYFTFHVEQVTHRENDAPKLWLTTRRMTKCEIEPDYWDEEDFDADVATYVAEGWTLASSKEKVPNNTSEGICQPADGSPKPST